MDDNRANKDQNGPVKRQATSVILNYIPPPSSTKASMADGWKDFTSQATAPAPTAAPTPGSVLFNQNLADLFSAQQQQNPATATSQPPPASGGSLFGGQTQNQQPPGSGSLFGGQQQNQPQQATSSLFGGQQQNQQPQATSSLFGGQQQNQQQQGTASLFGGQQNQQQQGTASLFGGQQNQQQQPASSLFGARPQNQQPQTSLFGGQPQNQQPQAAGSLFGGQQNQQNQQQQQAGSSFFGLNATQPQYAPPPTLLGASQYRATQYPQFAGRLTLGQQAAGPAGGAAGNAAGAAGAAGTAGQGQGAVQINFDTMRPTTRFNDCIPEIQEGLKKMDEMIAAQEKFCRNIEAFIPRHGDNVRSLQPDVELVTEKVDAVEHALSQDAQTIEGEKAVIAKDRRDGQRVMRVVDNLRQPREFHYNSFQQPRTTEDSADGSVVRDMDLIGNYFVPLTSSLQHTLNAYSSNIAEIEQHLRVIEASAVAQAQQLAAKRAGVRPDQGQNGEETVSELADTLRGFETSILGAASQVGQCREGLNELVLGRLGR